jgi:hypothetical protein
MPRQPIKTHQREASRFVLQWLVLKGLRCVQRDLSLKGFTKAHSCLDSLIRRDRYWDKFVLGLTEVLAVNPVRNVKSERSSRTEG